MNKCTHQLNKDTLKTVKEVPKSLSENDDYIYASKDCKENKSKLYSKYFFIRKDVCDKCKEETNNVK